MKRARTMAIAAAILAAATVTSAQRPDFSGTWTLDPAAAPAAGAGRGVSALGNGPATIKQNADTITIEQTIGGVAFTQTYKLDGTDSRNILIGPGGEQSDSMSNAKWDGPTLTIVTKQETAGQLMESTQVWSIAAGTLTVETTGGRGAQKRLYKKSM